MHGPSDAYKRLSDDQHLELRRECARIDQAGDPTRNLMAREPRAQRGREAAQAIVAKLGTSMARLGVGADSERRDRMSFSSQAVDAAIRWSNHTSICGVIGEARRLTRASLAMAKLRDRQRVNALIE